MMDFVETVPSIHHSNIINNGQDSTRRPKSVELFAVQAAKSLGFGVACDSLFRRRTDLQDSKLTLGQQRPSTWGPTESFNYENLHAIHNSLFKEQNYHDDENNNFTVRLCGSNSPMTYEIGTENKEPTIAIDTSDENERNKSLECVTPKEKLVVETPIVTFEDMFTFNSPPLSPSPNMSSEAGFCYVNPPGQLTAKPVGSIENTSKPDPIETEVKILLIDIIKRVVENESHQADVAATNINSSINQGVIMQNNDTQQPSPSITLHSFDKDQENTSTNTKYNSLVIDIPSDLHTLCANKLDDETHLLAIHSPPIKVQRKVGFLQTIDTENHISFDVASITEPRLSEIQQGIFETIVDDNSRRSENTESNSDTHEQSNVDRYTSSSCQVYKFPESKGAELVHGVVSTKNFESGEALLNINTSNHIENSENHILNNPITECSPNDTSSSNEEDQVLFSLMDNLLTQVSAAEQLPQHIIESGDGNSADEHNIKTQTEPLIESNKTTSEPNLLTEITEIENNISQLDDSSINTDADNNTPNTTFNVISVFDEADNDEDVLNEVMNATETVKPSHDQAILVSVDQASCDELFQSMEKCLKHDDEFFGEVNASKPPHTLVIGQIKETALQPQSDFFGEIPPSPHLRRTTFKLPNMEGLMTPQDEVDDFAADVFSEETEELLERANFWRRQDSFAGPSFLKQNGPLQTYEFDDSFNDGDFSFSGSNEPPSSIEDEKPPPVDRSTKPKQKIVEDIIQPTISQDAECDLSILNVKPPPLPEKPITSEILKETTIMDEKRDSDFPDSVRKIQRNSALSRGSATSSETVVAGEEYITRNQHLKSTTSSEGSHELTHDGTLMEAQSFDSEEDKMLEVPFHNIDRQTSKDGQILPSNWSRGEKQRSLPELRVSDSTGSLTDLDSSSNIIQYHLRSSNSSPLSSLTSSPTVSPELRHRQTNRTNRVYHVPLRDIEDEELNAEQQALEACNWLRAAGFPQYPSLYEEGSFPLDISMVSKDHDFLEEDLIEPLKRRLAILNKCASMKLNRRPTSDVGLQTDDEEDDQVPCAISERWHYDEGNRWSRNNDENNEFKEMLDDDAISKKEVYQRSASIDTATSSLDVSKKYFRDNDSDGTRSTTSSNKLKLKPSILKRVGGDLKKLRTPSFRRNTKPDGTKKRDKGREMVIGEPQLQTGHEKLDQFRCIPIGEKNNDVLMSLQQQHLNTRYSRPRKNSSQSLTSTSSSSAGGSSAASTPATRSRSSREKKSSHHRGRSVDAMLRDPTSPILMNNKQLLKSQVANGAHRLAPAPVNPEEKVFLVPKTHTPGTFPTIMSEVSEVENQNSSEDGETPLPNPKPQRRRPHKVKQRSISDFVGNQHRQQRPVSIYDNITDNKLHPAASAQDLLDILTPPSPSGSDVMDGDAPLPIQSSDAFWSVDDIMKQTESLKQRVHTWEDEENSINRRRRQHSVDISTHHTSEDSRTVSPLSVSNENLYESQEGLNQGHDENRSSHVSRTQWFGHRQPLSSLSTEPLQLHNLSVGQLMILSRLSVLKLTATMEKYTPVTNGSKSNNLNWTVPRFIKRTKVQAYKDRDVFGVPLVHNVQKYGHPIPHCILNAMAYIYNEALDQVGLFRKSGVKSRIQKIRNLCEADPELNDFDIEDVNAYDVADMVKQYFRDLPDHIMTAKLSETFTGIFLHVPTHLRLQSLHAAIMLLPDENREALKTLLSFLKSVADRSDENQMNESNLAVCFAPSIFFQNSSYSLSTNSPKGRKASRHGAGLALGKPDIKEMSENNAANLCLAFMIQKVNDLFTIPEDAMTQCRLSVMQQTQDVVATELGYPMVDSDQAEFLRDYHSYVNKIVAQTVREEQRFSHNKTSGWSFMPSESATEICYKKMNDGNPLRLWRCKVEIEGATVEQVLKRVRDERHLWDEDLIQGRIVEKFDENTECYQCLRAQMRPHPSREYCVMRSSRTNVSPRNLTVMVETSTDHPNAPMLDGVRGVVLTSQYIMESVVSSSSSDYTSSNSSLSSSGTQMQKCILTRLCRVDTKGRNPEWYNKAFGHIALRGLIKVRDSLRLQNNNNFIHAKLKESK